MRNRDRESSQLTPLIDRRQLLLGSLTLLSMAVLLIIGLTPRTVAAPETDEPAAQAGAESNAVLAEDCQLIQTLSYQPCGHEVVRRQTLPPELSGQNRSALEAAYDTWQVTSFAADEVRMSQTLSLYCPEHLVLMPDDSGSLCVFRNKYGDALALVSEMNILLEELPDAVQEELRPGKGFSTQEEIDLWLEANDS